MKRSPRCHRDIICLKQEHDESEEISDAVLTGAKTMVEAKTRGLGLCHLHQAVGNVVTYGFAYANRHPSQNSFVPVVGIWGNYGATFYDQEG